MITVESYAHIDFLKDFDSYFVTEGIDLNEDLNDQWAGWMIYF